MLPISITSGILMPMIDSFLPFVNKGFQFLLLLNPTTIISIALISFLYLTLKTTMAKIMFLGASLIVSLIVAYFIHKDSVKNKRLKNKKIDIEFSDSFFYEGNHEKELTLTKIFKK